jgi:hypothetical protein
MVTAGYGKLTYKGLTYTFRVRLPVASAGC